MIYLDNAATTRPDSRVVKEMLPYLTGRYGNPGSLYSLGREAKEAVALARNHTAELFGCDDEQVLFTSGGSEGNSLVFRGLADRLLSSGKTHILVSAIEHDSVLRVAEYLGRHGFSVEKIQVSAEGIVELPVLERMIRAETGLVSVQYVNNETGAVHPVSDIGSLCAKRGILFHTDCVQAAGTEKLDVAKIGCDFATVSGHKIHAPKGVGAVFVKTKELLSPLIFGGEEQEFGFRGGTENVPGIIGFLPPDHGEPVRRRNRDVYHEADLLRVAAGTACQAVRRRCRAAFQRRAGGSSRKNAQHHRTRDRCANTGTYDGYLWCMYFRRQRL